MGVNEKRISTLERQIEKIKVDISGLNDLRRGSLSKQYDICGSPGCKCKAAVPKKHGPYYQLSFTKIGKSSSKFVNKKNTKMVNQQVSNYANLRKLVKKWIELGTESVRLKTVRKKKKVIDTTLQF